VTRTDGWRGFARLAIALVLLEGVGSAFVAAQAPASDSTPSRTAALDVPYLPQSVLLCGGAALAMVERWWGRRGVYAEDFASLVKPALGGILQSEMDSTARARGWDTRALRHSPDVIRENLQLGIPAIALIQVAPDRYHYVVVLGWSDGRVVYHDPAGSPFSAMDETRFTKRWNAAGAWALVVQPRTDVVADTTAAAPVAVETSAMPCAPWLDQALDAVEAKKFDEAERLLARPGRPARQSRWYCARWREFGSSRRGTPKS